MKLKIWTSLFLVLLLAVGCSANEEKKVNELKKEETTATVKKEQTNVLQQNKELTKKVKEEQGVLDGQMYTQNGMAVGTLVLDKKVSDSDAKKLAEKYAKELKEEYKDMKVNVQAVRDGKNVANITLD
jgi:PBP1b-binding outer membrane lipoprotein LpoB